jgi:hypothetical protein
MTYHDKSAQSREEGFRMIRTPNRSRIIWNLRNLFYPPAHSKGFR